MIRSFRHKGIQTYFLKGSKAGIQPKHAARLRLQLGALDRAKGRNDMNASGWRLHALAGSLKGQWAVWVDDSWRLTFSCEDGNAMLVNYEDFR
ncbi:MAG TPA: type II toxin-antitoxin system RelE/ParE family toxin [Gammaproteobacteria bacterium]|nr:type II toxin-antitoxin system RelE/ParE family toxin [Gammaproteobacteria bacterium]